MTTPAPSSGFLHTTRTSADGPFPERAPQGFVLARRPMVRG
ncbi:hypothetical protein [Streptomyces sp. NPDC055886]